VGSRSTNEKDYPLPERVKVDIDGQKTPISAFFLTTAIPSNEAGHFLAFGNSDNIGQMLFSFWKWSIHESPEMAETMELVAKDIVDTAKKERGALYKEVQDHGTTH